MHGHEKDQVQHDPQHPLDPRSDHVRRRTHVSDHDSLSDLLSSKAEGKQTYTDAFLPPIPHHDQLAGKEGSPLDITALCHSSRNALDENYSDPFDEYAVVPDLGEDDEPDAQAMTFRSVLTGFLMGIFAATVSQVFVYKPVHLHIQGLFIQLSCLIIGRGMSNIPGPKWWNPGPLSVKETVFSAILASSCSAGAFSIEMIASLDLFFERTMPFYVCVLTIMSSQLTGYAWAGLFRRFLLEPKNMIFPSVLPSVALFHSLGKFCPTTQAQTSFFTKTFGVAAIYEIIPTYIAPALQAISPWCLTLPKSPVVTQIFGGAMVAEGMGIFALSADWTLVGGHKPLFVPLAAQVTDWAAVAVAIFLYSAAYRFDWFSGGNLPFMSFNLLDSTGARYNLSRAIFANGTVNAPEVQDMGTPYYSTAFVLGKAGTAFSVSSAIVAAILYNYQDLRSACAWKSNELKPDAGGVQPRLEKKTSDFSTFGFAIIGAVAIGTAFFCSSQADSGLPALGLGFAFFLSAILSFAGGFFNGTTGISLHCSPVVQMLGGILFPGNAIGNSWFTMYGATSVAQSDHLLRDLKLGQYMKLSAASVVTAQTVGTFIGGVVHYTVMKAIVTSQRDVLLLPHGNGIFTGMALSSYAAQATSWGVFSRELYFVGGKYTVIPFCLLFGFVAPIPIFLLHKWKPQYRFDRWNISLFGSSLYHAVGGATSGRTTATLLAIFTQYTLRKYHFKWYKKYNYIMSAALDGGTQLAVLLLTFLVQGGAGLTLAMPTYFLNPTGARDYCYMPHKERG